MKSSLRTKINVLAAICLMAFPCASSASVSWVNGTLVVRDDIGGPVAPRLVDVNTLNAHGSRVEITGRVCQSSCTLYLGVKNACVHPETLFGFHGPSQRGTPLPQGVFDHLSTLAAQNYPEPIKTWYMNTARFSITRLYEVSGEDLIRSGITPCQ